jgi:Rps23 Pro-64 3,4-dihydroxylase Tpa1-like proline 4-hydroxylase
VHRAELPNPPHLTDADVLALGERRALCFDGVLGHARTDAIRRAALALYEADRLRPAGIGRAATRTPEVRSDHILWLDDAVEGPFADVLALFESLRRQLGELAYLGAQTIEAQLSVYLQGLGYTRHRDAIAGSSTRRMTLIYYANEWQPGDGGELELHEPERTRVIEPVGDRLLVFRPELEHEVRPILRGQRIAISGWLRA